MAFTSRRVALFRASDDARNSASRLAAHGFEAVVGPVTAPVAMEATAPPGRFDAVVATSAKALDLASPALLAPLSGLPLYVVGSATVTAATRRRLSVVGAASDVALLASALLGALPRRGRVLYLAGSDRKPDLEAALNRASVSVATVEVYAAQAREGWGAEEARAVASCGAALHYSRRSAELALALAERAGILSQWRAMSHVAISGDAAEPLGASGAAKIIVAAIPREEAMLAALVAAYVD